jgi:DNA-binding YbaB/EbfC family protein
LKEKDMGKGFNRPMGGGGGGSQAGMMQQLKKLQEQMEITQAQLAKETVTSSAGGGAVKVTMTGDQRCTAIQIDPEIIKDADAEMLQDLILTAVNLSLDESRDLQSKRMGPLAGGVPGFPF